MTASSAIAALPHRRRRATSVRQPRHGAALLLLALALAGCSNVDRTVATSAIPADYHQRHPVVLADRRENLDIFLVGTRDQLDYRQKHDIEAFSSDYLAHGRGLIRVLVPRGSVDARVVEATLLAIRHGLAASGVTGDIEVGSYQVADSRFAAVLRMSYVKLQAGSAASCGDWPENLGPSPSLNGWDNGSYYNLGCANQNTLAAQVEDPRDLVHPRTTEPGDVIMRTRSIQNLRGGQNVAPGQDPSTSWTQAQLVPIGGG